MNSRNANSDLDQLTGGFEDSPTAGAKLLRVEKGSSVPSFATTNETTT